MNRCPNCGKGTMRLDDYDMLKCDLCGYPDIQEPKPTTKIAENVMPSGTILLEG